MSKYIVLGVEEYCMEQAILEAVAIPTGGTARYHITDTEILDGSFYVDKCGVNGTLQAYQWCINHMVTHQ